MTERESNTPPFVEAGQILAEIKRRRLYRISPLWRKVPPVALLALDRIREAELYKPAYATFEAYCESEWEIPAAVAEQVADAAALCLLETRLRAARERPRNAARRQRVEEGDRW